MVEGADVVGVADVADAEVGEGVVETRNKRFNPPTKQPAANRPVRRGNVKLNLMAVHTPE